MKKAQRKPAFSLDAGPQEPWEAPWERIKPLALLWLYTKGKAPAAGEEGDYSGPGLEERMDALAGVIEEFRWRWMLEAAEGTRKEVEDSLKKIQEAANTLARELKNLPYESWRILTSGPMPFEGLPDLDLETDYAASPKVLHLVALMKSLAAHAEAPTGWCSDLPNGAHGITQGREGSAELNLVRDTDLILWEFTGKGSKRLELAKDVIELVTGMRPLEGWGIDLGKEVSRTSAARVAAMKAK